MRTVTAQLAGGERNADRVLIADDAVVVLDGATAFEPVDLDPGEYAESIGREIIRRLPGLSIADALAGAIESTVAAHQLHDTRSPSSTVSVLRVRDDLADLYVLGDSPIYYGTSSRVHTLRDGRLDNLAASQRAAYKAALRAGHGYNEDHRLALVALQREQYRYRNRPDGYWIAADDPEAAHHGVACTVPASSISWAVLATDGASDLLADRPERDWREIASYRENRLRKLLLELHEWESLDDPYGKRLPRAKRHDDKTLVAVSNLIR